MVFPVGNYRVAMVLHRPFAYRPLCAFFTRFDFDMSALGMGSCCCSCQVMGIDDEKACISRSQSVLREAAGYGPLTRDEQFFRMRVTPYDAVALRMFSCRSLNVILRHS